MLLKTWMFVCFFFSAWHLAHGVLKVAGSWQVSPLDPGSAATDSPWWKSRAGRMNTAPVNRQRRDTAVCGRSEPHMSKPERRIETVFRRDEGCGQHLTWVTLVVTTRMVLHVAAQRPSYSHSSSTTSVLPEERVELCTKELVMVDVAMECHGDRFRTGDHSMASLAPLKETLFDQTQMQLPDNTWRVQDRVVEDTKRCECEGDDDRCTVDRPMLSTP